MANSRLSKHFDAYIGAIYSQVDNGLANGFLHRDTIDPTLGAATSSELGELSPPCLLFTSIDKEHLIVTEASTARRCRIIGIRVSLRIVTRNHVIDRRSVSPDDPILGCSRRREGGTENNCSGQRDFDLGEHCRTSC
jgi:hypothetical protein